MSFDEKERGSLEVGKSADMVILSENPLAADTFALDQIKVELVFLGGKSYKKVSQGPVKQVLKGLLTK
jgi:predicted amidohydrolase YtcJ